MRYLADGAGNRFLLIDTLAGPSPASPAADAPDVCERHSVDGLALLAPPVDGGEARMVLFNADGTRPEACGNGLRCIALAAFLGGHTAGREFVVETDSGARTCSVLEGDASVRVELGSITVTPGVHVIEVGGEALEGVCVDVGNPHFVLREEALEDERIERLGPVLATHESFPQGANVEFTVVESEFLSVRIHERGVGETQACGTGAAAAAAVAVSAWGFTWPVEVRVPGGVLHIQVDVDGRSWLTGPARLDALDAMGPS